MLKSDLRLKALLNFGIFGLALLTTYKIHAKS